MAHNEMATMLMFAGQAEEAIGLYTSVFPDSGVDFVERYGAENRVFAALSEGGSVMMELGAYPFAKRHVWLQDGFGVSWQLIFR